MTLSANYNYQGDAVKSEAHINEAYQRLHNSTDYALQARLYVEAQVLPLFEKIGDPVHLAGLIDYDHIYADTYRVLRAAGDPQAEDVLARGHAIFTRIAATIPNEIHRRSYWQSNPARRFVREEIAQSPPATD